MQHIKLKSFAIVLIGACSFLAGIWFAPDRNLKEVEKLQTEIETRTSQLKFLSEEIANKNLLAGLAQTELTAINAELKKAAEELLAKFQAGAQSVGLRTQDICEDYAIEYSYEYCNDQNDIETPPSRYE